MMSNPVSVDDFLKSQRSGFTATLEPVADKATHVKVTPYHGEHACGCDSAFQLPKDMIRSVTPTGTRHFCCGKWLEVVVVEFAENASVPVQDLIGRMQRSHHHHGHEHGHASQGHSNAAPFGGGARHSARMARPGGFGIVGRWPIPWTPCKLECIEVCTQFCSDTGWDCCQWETRCAITCDGYLF